MKRRHFIETGLALGASIALPAFAQTKAGYPTQTIKMIVAFGPGGSTDVTARIITAKMYELLGQRVVIENKPGGGSNIGSELAARGAPDGYTIFLGTVANAINMTLYKNPGYDIVRDFEPISMLSSAPAVLVVTPKLPVNTVQELIALARAKPDVPTMAEAGVPDFEITSWNGLFAPKGTPRDIVEKLNQVCVAISRMKDVQETFAAQAADSLSSTPAQFKAFIEAEIAKWGAVVKSTGAQI